MVFFERNQNERAESAFAAALEEAKVAMPAGPAAAELRCRAEFHRAQSVFKQRQRTRAAPAFLQAEAACKEAGNKDLLTKSRYQGARCLFTAGEREAALARYEAIQKEAPDHSYADDARLRAAEIYTESNELDKAAALLADLPDRYPGGDMMSEALWRLALAAIRQERWEEAHRWLDENLRRVPREEVWYAEGRALYWKARVFTKQGMKKEALTYMQRAVREYPLSVYALLAFERMRTEFPGPRAMLLRELHNHLVATPTSLSFGPRPIYRTAEFRRAVELARMGLGSDARRELASASAFTLADQPGRGPRRPTAGGRRAGGRLPGDGDAAGPGAELERGPRDPALLADRVPHRLSRWAAGHLVAAGLSAGVSGADRSQLQEQPGARGAAAGDHAGGELVQPAHRVGGQRAGVDPDAGQDGGALLSAVGEPGDSARPGQEPGAGIASTWAFCSSATALWLRWPSPATTAAKGRWIAGCASAATWSWTSSWRRFRTTRPGTTPSGCSRRYLSYSWLYDPKHPVPELRFTLKPPPTAERAGRNPRSRTR